MDPGLIKSALKTLKRFHCYMEMDISLFCTDTGLIGRCEVYNITFKSLQLSTKEVLGKFNVAFFAKVMGFYFLKESTKTFC